jgi:hypothetical protein
MEDSDYFDDYFRRRGSAAPQPTRDIEWVSENGIDYAVLVNVDGPLAVYGPDGYLNYSDWPSVLLDR